MIYTNQSNKYSEKEWLIHYIRLLAVRLGYTPTRSDIPRWKMAKIKKYYGAWSKIINEAGLESYNTDHQKALRQEALGIRIKKLAKVYSINPESVDRREYELLKIEFITSKKCEPKDFAPIGSQNTKEEIQAYLQAMEEELGYTPTMAVATCVKPIVKKYKNWDMAIEDAGLELSDTLSQIHLREEINDRKFLQLLVGIMDDSGKYLP